MDDLKPAIVKALASDGPLPRQLVRQWLELAQELETLALLYRLTDEAWHRIEPPLEAKETCDLIRTYLLRCIEEDPQDDWALTRYEAAGELESWFDHLASMPEDRSAILQESAAAVTEAFLRGGEKVRLAIEQGFLEHVLEQAEMRPLFEHWATHKDLHTAWEAAIEWADEHPNFMKSVRERLRSASNEDKRSAPACCPTVKIEPSDNSKQ